MNTCIFCKKQKEFLSEEHIIPDSVLNKRYEKVILINYVCKECNNKFGHTIDSEFLNDKLIKIIRLLHKDFINKDSNPKLLFNSFTKVTINKIEVPLDLLIDKNGYKVSFSKKPIKDEYNNCIHYFIKEKDVPNFIKTMEKKKKIKNLKINLNRISPKIDFSLERAFYTTDMIEHYKLLFFPRVIVKMAIEYICKKFGSEIIMKKNYDVYRDFVFLKTNYCSIKYNMGLIREIKDEKEVIKHEIGIKFDENLNEWIFFFNLYNKVKYMLVLPYENIYKEIIDIISFS